MADRNIVLRWSADYGIYTGFEIRAITDDPAPILLTTIQSREDSEYTVGLTVPDGLLGDIRLQVVPYVTSAGTTIYAENNLTVIPELFYIEDVGSVSGGGEARIPYHAAFNYREADVQFDRPIRDAYAYVDTSSSEIVLIIPLEYSEGAISFKLTLDRCITARGSVMVDYQEPAPVTPMVLRVKDGVAGSVRVMMFDNDWAAQATIGEDAYDLMPYSWKTINFTAEDENRYIEILYGGPITVPVNYAITSDILEEVVEWGNSPHDCIRFCDMESEELDGCPALVKVPLYVEPDLKNMDYMFTNATSFQQDLTNWCVENVTSEPTEFATGSGLTTDKYPVWGTCPTNMATLLDGEVVVIGGDYDLSAVSDITTTYE